MGRIRRVSFIISHKLINIFIHCCPLRRKIKDNSFSLLLDYIQKWGIKIMFNSSTVVIIMVRTTHG